MFIKCLVIIKYFVFTKLIFDIYNFFVAFYLGETEIDEYTIHWFNIYSVNNNLEESSKLLDDEDAGDRW